MDTHTMSLPADFQIFGAVRLEDRVAESGHPDRVASRSTYQRRSSRRPNGANEGPPLRKGKATLVCVKPGSRVVMRIKGVPYGEPLGSILPGIHRRLPAGLRLPREGQDIMPGEPLLVVMGRRKLIGPIKMEIPVEVYRVDGSLLWRSPQR